MAEWPSHGRGGDDDQMRRRADGTMMEIESGRDSETPERVVAVAVIAIAGCGRDRSWLAGVGAVGGARRGKTGCSAVTPGLAVAGEDTKGDNRGSHESWGEKPGRRQSKNRATTRWLLPDGGIDG